MINYWDHWTEEKIRIVPISQTAMSNKAIQYLIWFRLLCKWIVYHRELMGPDHRNRLSAVAKRESNMLIEDHFGLSSQRPIQVRALKITVSCLLLVRDLINREKIHYLLMLFISMPRWSWISRHWFYIFNEWNNVIRSKIDGIPKSAREN